MAATVLPLGYVKEMAERTATAEDCVARLSSRNAPPASSPASDRSSGPRHLAYRRGTRPHGVRYLFASYDRGKDRPYGHIKPTKIRTKFLEFCRYLRSLYPPKIRLAIVFDNFSPRLTMRNDARVGDWAAANNVELAYTPTNSSWSNRIEAQLTALRYFAPDGTVHASHKEQGSMIRRYIIWRNKHAADERLRKAVTGANVA